MTNEPLAWFDRVIACGLEGVQATSVQCAREQKPTSSEGEVSLSISEEMGVLAGMFGDEYDREICWPHCLNLIPAGPMPGSATEVRMIVDQEFSDKTFTLDALRLPANSQFIAMVSDATGVYPLL